MTPRSDPPLLEPVDEVGRAELLLHPLRQRILYEAYEASTAAEIARRVGLSPQRVNYHVRTLVDAGLLQPAGESLKRNLVEKRYRASARSYLLLPQILGDVSPVARGEAERFSATEQRAAFARALRRALTEVIGEHTAPARDPDGHPRPGRPYRLVLGCYPVPDPGEAPGPAPPEPQRRP